MAVAPLFLVDMDKLLGELRLDHLGSESPAYAVLEGAVVDARTWFYKELGQTRIDEIAAYVQTDAPTTNEGYLRLMAARVEVKMVRFALLRDLPAEILGGAYDNVLDEMPFRSLTTEERHYQRNSLRKEILSDLGDLKDGTVDGDGSAYVDVTENENRTELRESTSNYLGGLL